MYKHMEKIVSHDNELTSKIIAVVLAHKVDTGKMLKSISFKLDKDLNIQGFTRTWKHPKSNK